MRLNPIFIVALMISAAFFSGCKLGSSQSGSFALSDINGSADIVMPIDSAKEAAIYSNTFTDFASYRDSFIKTDAWVITPVYQTEQKYIDTYNSWYQKGDIKKDEYDERVAWAKANGDYWTVSWSYGSLLCGVSFRQDGSLKNATTNRSGLPYNCDWLMK